MPIFDKIIPDIPDPCCEPPVENLCLASFMIIFSLIYNEFQPLSIGRFADVANPAKGCISRRTSYALVVTMSSIWIIVSLSSMAWLLGVLLRKRVLINVWLYAVPLIVVGYLIVIIVTLTKNGPCLDHNKVWYTYTLYIVYIVLFLYCLVAAKTYRSTLTRHY